MSAASRIGPEGGKKPTAATQSFDVALHLPSVVLFRHS